MHRPKGLPGILPLWLLTLPVMVAAQVTDDTMESLPDAPAEASEERLPLPVEEVRLFTEALDLIRSAYVEEVDDRTLLEYAIRGMLEGLDPHSDYLDESDYDSLEESTQGQFGGLGIEVGEENGYIRIISPIDDSPADRAGIEAGDLIVEIDGRPVREMSISDAVDLLRGEPGTSISLTLRRDDETIDVALEREIIAANSVRTRMLEPGYAYLRISQFRTNTGDEVREALDELYEDHEELNGLVLDLRNNPGGVLQAAVGVADAFLTDGMIVYTDGRMDRSDAEYHADSDDPSHGVPMVVLVNTGSASAAEIVAGALQDQGRAVVMGMQTFGKGSVQTLLPLNNERALKLTTSLYFTPDGRSIQAQGITPDVEVREGLVTRETPRRGVYSEADLAGHLGNRNEGDDTQGETPGDGDAPEDASGPTASGEQIVIGDYQLNEALTLLRGWHIMRDRQTRREGQR